jgi:hypothetical protein
VLISITFAPAVNPGSDILDDVVIDRYNIAVYRLEKVVTFFAWKCMNNVSDETLAGWSDIV